MPLVTIYIAPPNTPYNDGTNTDPSKYGHMWYELDNGSGTKESFGFGPIEHQRKGVRAINFLIA